jgi:SAM-dependent methyltransferase
MQAVAPLARPAVLDVGAGAGRIGKAFVAAGDDYVGVDLSVAMLTAFRSSAPSARLVLADAARLPFDDRQFDAALMVQVLNSTQDWRDVIAEVRRILERRGVLIVGRGEAPEDGVDTRLKQRLASILAGMGQDPYRPAANEDAVDRLAVAAERVETRIVGRWEAARTPRQFLERHGTGARFSALPPDVRQAALERLQLWVETEIGSLDTVSTETHCFEIKIFHF